MHTPDNNILARLAQAVPIATRRMFGCTGVYSDGVFFAIVDGERLFFKVDDATRPMYEGMSAFEPNGRISKKYYEVPDHVIDDPETLQQWALLSVEAARKP